MNKEIYQPEFIPFYLKEVNKHNLSPKEGLVYGFIRFYSQNNDFYFSSEDFSKIIGCSVGTIDNAVNKLVRVGLIKTETKRYNSSGIIKSHRRIILLSSSNNENTTSSNDEDTISSHNEIKEITKEITKENIESVFKYRLTKKIVNHNKITKDIDREIKKRLKDFTVQEIQESIDNYTSIYFSKETFRTHRRTLAEFMKRDNGMPTFLHKGIEDYKEKKTEVSNNPKEYEGGW